jgi:P27 family predicted phage terminase small subunit
MPTWKGTDKEKQRLHSPNRGKRDRRGLHIHKDRRKAISISSDMIKVPSWMTDEEKAIFEDMRSNILMFDIASLSDKYSFELLCIQYTQYFSLSRIIAQEGYMVEVESNNGMVFRKPHPLLSERHRLYNSCSVLMKEFGMTPNTRRKVLRPDPEKPENEEENEWEEFLN